MKHFKNFLAGLVVSFIGSIPLGYLNVIGCNIYMDDGSLHLLFYILGVIAIEGIVIAVTLSFAKWLIQQKNLIFWLELTTVLFLIFLAGNFYFATESTTESNIVTHSGKNISGIFIFGAVMSALNVVQLPFWAGWNIYLLDNGYIQEGKLSSSLYLIGALSGTMAAMIVLALVVSEASTITPPFLEGKMHLLLPILFLSLAAVQVFKMVKKYWRK